MQNTVETRAETVTPRRRFAVSRGDVIVAVLMVFTLLLGAYFRFTGLNWDDFVRFHPDERYLTSMITPSIGGPLNIPDCGGANPCAPATMERYLRFQECLERYPDTGGRGGYFDTQCSPYHPENVTNPHYVYGTLPVFMVRAAAEVVADQTDDTSWLTSNRIHIVWRVMSAAADMIVIWMVFLTGLKIHNKWTGLLAAFLYAAAVLPIQQAHFGTTDAITNMFVAIGLFFAVRTQLTGSWWDYAAFGAALGAAVASRINVAPLAAVIAIVAAVRMLPMLTQGLPLDERNRLLVRDTLGVVIAAVVSFVVFRVFQPYAFAGPTIFGILPDPAFLETLASAQFNVSGQSEIPPNYQWVGRISYLFPWQNMVLWGMGIALGLTAWFGWLWTAVRLIRGRLGATRTLVPFIWIGGYFAYTGSLWVMSMRYYLPLYPAFAVLAAWVLVELVERTSRGEIRWRQVAARGLLAGVAGFTLLWAAMFTNIYRNQATFTQASYWVWENVPGDFTMTIDDAPPGTPWINIALPHFLRNEETWAETLVAQGTNLMPNIPAIDSFVAPADGRVTTVRATRIGDPVESSAEKTVRVSVREGETGEVLATAEVTDTFPREAHPMGEPYTFTFAEPLQLEAGETYTFAAEVVEGDALISGGSVVAREPWDEVMPAAVCTLPYDVTLADDLPPGYLSYEECTERSSPFYALVNGFELAEWPFEDTHRKQQALIDQFNYTDYIIIGTNRRYDTHSRNPTRWPLVNRTFEAMFNGELGFEIAAVFEETFELGPLKVSDQHLPTYDAPDWLNEFEAEEAFHVYDHPVVFIFKKTEDYSPTNTRAILESVPLDRPRPVLSYNDPMLIDIQSPTSLEANPAPTQLEMTDQIEARQYESGTWSNRFNVDSIVNSNQVVTLVLWWLMIMVFGWAVWPLLFVTLPALADRGYAFAKFTGMTLVAWLAWVLSTMRLPFWSQGGIALLLLAVAGLSAFIFWRNRERFGEYLRQRRVLLVGIELITLALFLVLVGVRLTNPDLWHPSFGGEKPMDFAYFNGVLRSSIFPAIDPWFAGGYLNYYYFGFVIVGTPTLLLGVVPSIAYNLIIPTLFATTGIAAFAVAFSLVNGWCVRRPSGEVADADDEEDGPASAPTTRVTLGNPWVAGVMALLLAVVLGNLGTVRELMVGASTLGGYRAISIEAYLIEDFLRENQREPDQLELAELYNRASNPGFGDQVSYQFDEFTEWLGATIRGTTRALNGETLPIGAERWFWGPTRIIAENSAPPGQFPQDGAIHEMPYFTFLYGDLHAHMISMPLQLFALAFLFNELMVAGRDRRRWFTQAAAIFLGALTVGLFQATNTWEYPTFMILGVLGLGYAWWLRWERFTRWSVLDMLLRVGGFVVLATVVALPFTYWFASGLTAFKQWQGPTTALWIYLTIHGLFLFLVLSLLTWETARWLRSTRVRALQGRLWMLWLALGAVAAGVLAALVLVLMGYPVGLIVVPLVVWIGVLFFRPGQSRPMQFALVLAGLALTITLGTEFITLANDNGRQNTIFKFYLQAWLMLSVVGGVGFAWVIRESIRWRTWLAVFWYGVAAMLIFVAALFPILSTRGKAAFRFTHDVPVTLDGLAYMNYVESFNDLGKLLTPIDLEDEYEMIRWMQENVEGSPVIMEGQSWTPLYHWGGRISINTGLPAVVGWDYHQRQQRSINELPTLVNQRRNNVNAFYTTTDIETAVWMLHHYEVRYVVVGDFERARYDPANIAMLSEAAPVSDGGLEKFEAMADLGLLEPVYEDGGNVIYAVNPDELWQYTLAQTAADDDEILLSEAG